MTDKRQKPRPSAQLIQNAKELRKEATFPERLLWSRLRRGQVHGYRFRRQHAIAGFIVDFVCTDASLIIEVDGDSHIGRAQYDTDRQSKFVSMGYRVLRIRNDDILRDLDSIVDGIANAVKQATATRHPPPAPPSREGG